MRIHRALPLMGLFLVGCDARLDSQPDPVGPVGSTAPRATAAEPWTRGDPSECLYDFAASRTGAHIAVKAVAGDCADDDAFFAELDRALATLADDEAARISAVALMRPTTTETAGELQQAWGQSCLSNNPSLTFLASYQSGTFARRAEGFLAAHGLSLRPTQVDNFYLVPPETRGAIRHDACRHGALMNPVVWFTPQQG